MVKQQKDLATDIPVSSTQNRYSTLITLACVSAFPLIYLCGKMIKSLFL